jgi:DHA1 family bicyclomycin/chloramphenicol resistance-like MFS transporter
MLVRIHRFAASGKGPHRPDGGAAADRLSGAPVALSRAQIVLLALLGLVGTSAISVVLPSLPAIAVELRAAPGSEALVLTFYLAGLATGQLVWGPASDRWGRRRMMLAGLALYLVGSLACAAAPTMAWLVAFRLVQALGACAGPVLTRAIARDLYVGDALGRMMALLSAVLGAAPLVGPVLGGVLEVWFGWRAVFLLFGGAGVVLAIAVWSALPETMTRAAAPIGMLRAAATLAADRGFVLAVLSGGALSAIVYVYQAGAPRMFIADWGMSPDAYGCLGFATAAGYVTVTWLLARRRAAFRATRLAVIGGLLALAGSSAFLSELLAGVTSLWIILPTLMSISIGMGFGLPALGASALEHHPQIAGAASAGLGFVTMGMGGAATLILSMIGAGKPGVMALMMVVAAVGAASAATLLARAGSRRS